MSAHSAWPNSAYPGPSPDACNTAIGRDVAGALAHFNIPVSDHALHQRVVYAESAARGLGVIEPLARPAGARLAQSLLARMERAAA